MTEENNNKLPINRNEIESAIKNLQQQGGGKIKVEHTLIETLTIEVDSQGINKKDYEKVQEDLKIYPESQTLLERQPESQNSDQKEEAIIQENLSKGEEKVVATNPPNTNQTNNNDGNSGSEGS